MQCCGRKRKWIYFQGKASFQVLMTFGSWYEWGGAGRYSIYSELKKGWWCDEIARIVKDFNSLWKGIGNKGGNVGRLATCNRNPEGMSKSEYYYCVCEGNHSAVEEKEKGGVEEKGALRLLNAIHPTQLSLKNSILNGNNPVLVPGLLQSATKLRSRDFGQSESVQREHSLTRQQIRSPLSSRHSPNTPSLKKQHP